MSAVETASAATWSHTALIYTGAFGDSAEEDLPFTSVIRERQPIPRLGRPSDFEAIAAYLASPAASFHTGDVIVQSMGATHASA